MQHVYCKVVICNSFRGASDVRYSRCRNRARVGLSVGLATYTRTVPLWLRYVDDTFTAVHKDGIDNFHEHLNRQNADIQFSKEIEENGKIPFLDCLVTCDNNKLKTSIYRKLTHTDRVVDQSYLNNVF